ncbi:MAG: DNA mismatch repair protein MutS [bacterium]
MRRFTEERDVLARRARWIANLRLACFLLAVTGVATGLWQFERVSYGLIALGVVLLGGFVLLVLRHDRVLTEQARLEKLVAINEEALLRLDREWEKLTHLPVPEAAVDDPVGRDLDLFHGDGRRASLYQLLGTANTPAGRVTLARWLLRPADPGELVSRQAAVAELSPLLDWRQELAARGRDMARLPPDTGPFLAWAEGEPWLLQKAWRVWVPRILAVAMLALLALHIAGVLPPLWLGMVIVNLLYTAAFGGPARSTFEQVSWRERAFRHFARLFQPLSETRFESAKIRGLQQRLQTDGLTAHQQMRRLDSINGYADLRHSGLPHLALQALTLWDFHVLCALERWQQRVGRMVRQWFDVLGEVETLCALAGLHHDEPGWVFPEVAEEGGARFEAQALGHPLLPRDACVANDVTIGPAGTFLLVTGSNMSGKSTLLRAVGVNVVLAQAGGPVFAQGLRMAPLELGTSFRVQDSLEAGVSFFMAELSRLKEIVDLAEERREARGRTLLFLLDEILQGTNVFERQVAVRHVILYLLEQGAIGAISTHDLSLADAEGLTDACQPVHFTESYENGAEGARMHFDYTLRPGVAPTVNALKLLEIVGLGKPSPAKTH